MKKNRGSVGLCLILSIILLLSACGVNAPAGDRTGTSDVPQAQETESGTGPAVRDEAYATKLKSYGIELPVSRTRISVNQSGYSASRDKEVIFLGDSYGDTFRVVRKSDNKVVRVGRINAAQTDGLSGQTVSICDFSQVTEPGSYYIETDIIGQSYPFEISEDAYERLFLGLLANMSDARLEESAKGVCDVSFGMHILLYSLQKNGALYEQAYAYMGDAAADGDMVARLLYMAQWLLTKQGEDGSLYGDYEATAAFCGIMAMGRNTFGKYEATVSKELQDAAERAWQWLAGNACDSGERRAARFYAAMQLLDATGNREYRQIVDEFLAGYEGSYTADRFVFYGVWVCLNAEQNIDRDTCTHIMLCLVDETEQICNEAEKDELFGIGERSLENTLRRVLLLCFINYITPSKEYTLIVENSIQYIGGLNETGECHIGPDGRWRDTDASLERNFEWNGIVLFCFGDMLKNINDMAEE
ncbi:MAG: hypothetical protein NC337_03630 [Roseburia sp.]|nr:hypothetical protein [Roseburia sp.]